MRPAVFSDLDVATARERSKLDGTLLLVDVTTKGARPSTSWNDTRVIECVQKHAIAVQLDLELDRSTSSSFGLHGPALVAFAKGAEIDRVARVMPRAMVAWIEGLARGVTSRDTRTEVEAGRTRGRQYTADGRPDLAAAEYMRLWDRHPDATWRRTLTSDVRRVIEQSPLARAPFSKLRDAMTPVAGAVIDTEALSDWVTLNRILDEPECILRWFDQLDKARLRELPWAFWTEREVVEVLVARERWADAGAAISDPSETLRRAHDSVKAFESLPEPTKVAEAALEHVTTRWRSIAARLVYSLSAANRVDDARRARDVACGLDPSPETAAAIDPYTPGAGEAERKPPSG